MAVAAAEQINNQNWLLAQEAFPGAELRARVRVAETLGRVAVRGEAEHYDEQIYDDSTLKSAIDAGDRQMVRPNVSKDISERLFKVGPQEPTYLRVINQRIQQNGRWLTDFARNALQHTILVPDMLQRTGHELHNAAFFEELIPEGAFETHDVVVFSPSSTTMTTEEKRQYNFFLETESCSIQRLSIDGEEAELETAFVAGKAIPTSERHDIATIIKLAARKNIPIMTIDGTDMIQYVMLIPKDQLPNGVINVVQAFDEAAGGTFYGEAKPQQNYVEHARECAERNRQFDSIVDEITEQLITEAPSFSTPLAAIMRLDELSEERCVKLAVDRKDINAAIFGPTAAMHIEEARFFAERGQVARAEDSLMYAQMTAVSGSCPLFKSGRFGNFGEGLGGDDEDDFGPLTFTCKNGHLNRRRPGKENFLTECQRCRVSVKC